MDTTDIEQDFANALHYKHTDSWAECAGPGCTEHISPHRLYCSKKCFSRAASWNKLDYIKQGAMKAYHAPDFYLQASIVDGGLWWDRMNPMEYKKRHHRSEWEANYGEIFANLRKEGRMPEGYV